MSVHPDLQCSFCGKPASEVKKLIEGPDVYICDKCIDVCYEILHKNSTTASVKSNPPDKTNPTPREIKDFLDLYVIGQDHAKEIMSVAVYNHYKRLNSPTIDGIEIDKSNILMLGPTGVGKTLLVETLARMLDVPFAVTDATNLTQAGYVGEDVESIIGRLLTAANYDAKKTERGIVFIDEVDKKSARSGNGVSTIDVGGEGVQQALLKLLEGSDVMVPTNGVRNKGGDLVKINTRNILFIVGGAFVGLDKIISRALSKETSNMGIGSVKVAKKTTSELLMQVEPEHLITFGMIPELVGRLPIVTPLDELTEAQLVRVLTEPKNALIKQFTVMFRLDGIKLEFDDDALIEIAKIASTRKTGGRGLRSVMERLLMKVQFKLPELRESGVTKITIGRDSVVSGAEPTYISA